MLTSEVEASEGQKVFCSGGDISTVQDVFLSTEFGLKMSYLMHDTLLRLKSLPLVSVCLVNGRAIG